MNIKGKKKCILIPLIGILTIVFVLLSKTPNPDFLVLYYSYCADIFIPFLFYFLLHFAQDDFSLLEPYWIKGLFVFGLCSISETIQLFGFWAFARVFDPFDYVMYFIGTLIAIFVDRQLFHRLLEFWD